ncbi:MAG: type II toxin-antitoxin system HicA family toxin, partial [Sphaerobacter sp.]|nr:type II toxin-antitoxin system HicA family toxin [Sphaerobacter sp.]
IIDAQTSPDEHRALSLQRAGFQLSHTRGSHVYLRRSGTATLITVLVHGHRVLPPDTLRSILRHAGLTVDELIALLHE